jgi:hypothetical protein
MELNSFQNWIKNKKQIKLKFNQIIKLYLILKLMTTAHRPTWNTAKGGSE